MTDQDYDWEAIDACYASTTDFNTWDWTNNKCETGQTVCDQEGGKWVDWVIDNSNTMAVCDYDGFEIARLECWNSATDSGSWNFETNVCEVNEAEESTDEAEESTDEDEESTDEDAAIAECEASTTDFNTWDYTYGYCNTGQTVCDQEGGNWIDVVDENGDMQAFCDYGSMSLMKAAANSSESSYTYVGASFCAIGIIAAGVLAASRKNKVNSNEDSLLATENDSFNRV